MRLRALILAIGLAVGLGCGLAPAADAADEDARIRATPPVWRISDDDSTVYLLGAFHVLPENVDWRSAAIARAFDASETIWFEAETDTAAAQEAAGRILSQQGYSPEGVSLGAMLDSDDNAALFAIAAEVGIPIETLQRMRPWQAFLALSVQAIVAEGHQPGAGVEVQLLNEARARGRDIRFLSSVEDELGLFAAMTPDEEIGLLQKVIRHWDEEKSAQGPQIEAWAAGDAERLDALVNAPLRETSADAFAALIIAQNENWTAKTAEILAGRGAAMVVLGAGYLVGDAGVPAMLAEQGFTIERIAD